MAKASEGIVASLAVARSLASEPMFISQVNRRTCLAHSRSALERLLSRTERLGDDQLLLLSSAFADAYDPEAWTRALAGDQCIVLAMHERPELLNDQGSLGVPRVALNAWKELGLADRSGAAFLRLMDRLMDVRYLPLHERLAAARSVDEARRGTSGTCFIVHKFGPSAVSAVTVELGEIALSRTAVCAVAVERYRLAHGRLPEALAEVVPRYCDSVPQDPFDGEPLRYRLLERGYVVYSIGPDETDDGGKEPPLRKGSDKGTPPPYDITFIVER